MAREQLAVILQNSAEHPPPADPSPSALRHWFEGIQAPTPIAEGCSFERVECTAAGGDLTTRPPCDQTKLIIFYHGGGFLFGSSRSHRVITTHLARLANCAVLSVDYRLAPEHPAPAAHEDALQAYRWALSKGYEPKSIVLAGDSAGGNLALSTALRARDAGLPRPSAVVSFSGAFDLAGDGASHRELADAPLVNRSMAQLATSLYVGSGDPRSAQVTPLHADVSRLPPTLLHVGTWELLRDDSVEMARRLQAAGNTVELKVWDGMCHDWQLFAPFLDEGMQSLEEAAAFIVRTFASS